MKTVYYWSPSLTKVATNKAVINSAISLKKFSKNFNPVIIDVSGEFLDYEEELKKEKIEKINLYLFNYHKILPKNGFIKSRLSYLIIIALSFVPLLLVIKRNKPDFLIVHLITSLPLIMFLLFSFKTKIILRISGLPKLTRFRKNLWRISNKIFAITCPTKLTFEQILKSGVFNSNKLYLLRDPIIDIRLINQQKYRKEENLPKKYLLAAGRLTRQKNFIFLIDSISDFLHQESDYKLIILGEGEQENELKKRISRYNLTEKVLLLGYKKNIFNYLNNAKIFILTSLWEDPGFVIVEAAASNTSVLSSNCNNGPVEILSNGLGGYLFESNHKLDFISKLKEALSDNKSKIFLKKIVAKKNSKLFTKYSHFKSLQIILNK